MFKCQTALVCALICFACALTALVLVLCMLHLIWALTIAPVDDDSPLTTSVSTPSKDEQVTDQKVPSSPSKGSFISLSDSFISLRRFLHLLKATPLKQINILRMVQLIDKNLVLAISQ